MKKLIALSALAFASTTFAADVAYSPPVGGMTISVPSGQTRAITLPLFADAVGAGKVIGQITGVGSNYIDVSDANWSPGAFSSASNPYILRIKTGIAEGRVIPVSTTANTATRIFLVNDGFALNQVYPIAAGDRFELVLADTLGSFFGSHTLQGGTSAQNADNVQIWANTAWVTYYYNTERQRWERSTDSAASASRDNTLLRPDRGFMIVRRASTPLNMTVVGRVPDVATKHIVAASGSTFFSNGLPAQISLGSLSLQTRVAGWKGVSGPANALANADLVQISANTAWVYYYYDTARGSWQRSTDTAQSASRDGVVVPAGQAVMLRRLGTAQNPSDNFVTIPLPYALN